MKKQITLALATAVMALAAGPATYTGVITDNMCDNGDHKDMKMGNDPKCVVECVKGFEKESAVLKIYGVGDPSCIYDAATQRFILTVYDGESDADGNFTGPTTVDIAVSPQGTTLGTWSIYELDTTNDGTNGTPSNPSCPCFPPTSAPRPA